MVRFGEDTTKHVDRSAGEQSSGSQEEQWLDMLTWQETGGEAAG